MQFHNGLMHFLAWMFFVGKKKTVAIDQSCKEFSLVHNALIYCEVAY